MTEAATGFDERVRENAVEMYSILCAIREAMASGAKVNDGVAAASAVFMSLMSPMERLGVVLGKIEKGLLMTDIDPPPAVIRISDEIRTEAMNLRARAATIFTPLSTVFSTNVATKRARADLYAFATACQKLARRLPQ